MFKFILIVLLFAMLVSLALALKSLFTGQSSDTTKTYRWLRIRVALALAIFIVTAIGFYTGELSIGAPWLGQY